MTWRFDSTQLISGQWLFTEYPGYGISGSAIPAGSVFENDFDTGDENKGFRAVWLTAPSSGTFTPYEDGGFTLSGAADGVYSATYRLFVDDVDMGVAAVTITIGGGATTAVGVSITTSFAVLNTAGRSLTTSFAVDGVPGLTPVGADLTTSFAVLRAVGASLTTRFAVASATSDGDEPVTIEEAARWARVDDLEESALDIASLITAARRCAEVYTGRVYKSTVRKWTGWTWPADVIKEADVTSGRVFYWDGAAMVELDPSAYLMTAAVGRLGTVVVPQLGMAWPDLSPKAAGARVRIEMTFTRNPVDVDETVKLFIKAQVSGWFNNPDAVSSKKLEADPRLERLLDGERAWLV